MNAKEVERALKKHLEAALKSAEAALYQGASIIMTEAKERAPIDLGTMRNSGYVTLPQSRGGNTFVEAGFGGAAKAYAVRQHEELSYNHTDPKTGIAVGEAKYLENAINVTENQVRARIEKIARRGLETGVVQAMGEKAHEEKPSEEVMTGESKHRRRKR